MVRTAPLLVLSALVSASVAAGTAWLVAGRTAPADVAPERASVDASPAPSGAGGTVGGLRGRSPPEDPYSRLEERIARLERSAGAAATGSPPVRREDVLARLVSLRDGEQQVAMREARDALLRAGEAAVPDVVEVLRKGTDRSYGGGMSTSGSVVTAYPRLRTVLFDVLRQIGTREAKRGFIDAVHAGASLEDYRDLLMLYGLTTDAEVIEAVSALLPEILSQMKDVGLARVDVQAPALTYAVEQWLHRYRVPAAVPALASLVEVELAAQSYRVQRLFSCLVDLSPDQAFAVTERLAKRPEGQQTLRWIPNMLAMGDMRLESLASYCDFLFAGLNLDAPARRSIYMQLPSEPNPRIEPEAERARDARVLLAFMDRRSTAESDESLRAFLAEPRSRLAAQLEGVGRDR